METSCSAQNRGRALFPWVRLMETFGREANKNNDKTVGEEDATWLCGEESKQFDSLVPSK